MFLTFGRSGILNRSQFWIHINFSETLQDIQSVGLNNLIMMISVTYTKIMISEKETGFVGLSAIREFKRTSTQTIKTLLW